MRHPVLNLNLFFSTPQHSNTMPSPSRSSPRPISPPAAPNPDRRHHRSHHSDSHRHHHRHREDRSRSPRRSDRHKTDHRHHRRHDRDRDRHERQTRASPIPTQQMILPFQAQELSRRSLEVYSPLFAMYLDIQKGIVIEDLNEEEMKGRWKSFVRKW